MSAKYEDLSQYEYIYTRNWRHEYQKNETNLLPIYYINKSDPTDIWTAERKNIAHGPVIFVLQKIEEFCQTYEEVSIRGMALDNLQLLGYRRVTGIEAGALYIVQQIKATAEEKQQEILDSIKISTAIKTLSHFDLLTEDQIYEIEEKYK